LLLHICRRNLLSTELDVRAMRVTLATDYVPGAGPSLAIDRSSPRAVNLQCDRLNRRRRTKLTILGTVDVRLTSLKFNCTYQTYMHL